MKTIRIVENDEVGIVADISHALGSAKININSIHVDVVAGKAIITIGISDAARGREVLESAGYTVEETDELVIALDDKPGELDTVARILAKGRINIEKMITLSNNGEKSVLSIKVDDPAKAAVLLKKYLIADDMSM